MCCKALVIGSINYRESYNMFASNGILFNHESPIRGELVQRKLLMVYVILNLDFKKIFVGNLNAKEIGVKRL